MNGVCRLPDKELFGSLIKKLETPVNKKVSLGFDGFLDYVLYVVETRYDSEHYKRMEYMADYGSRITKAAGKSTNIEMFPILEKIGGNGPILANSLKKLGHSVSYIGALGKASVNPAFADMCSGMEVCSVADPAKTDAIEFLDGKIISSQLSALNDVRWETLKEKVGINCLKIWIESADVVGFVNWTLLIHMSGIWRGMQKELLPLIETGKSKYLFIDLADPMKRTKEHIEEALNLISGFQKYFSVVLGLNYTEAQQIAKICDINMDSLEQLCVAIKNKLNISQVVIHPVKEACAAWDEGSAVVKGPYCEKPVLTTGAGDNFNAGYLTGLLHNCTQQESLLAGTANSGFYVRNGQSASADELIEFLRGWRRREYDS